MIAQLRGRHSNLPKWPSTRRHRGALAVAHSSAKSISRCTSGRNTTTRPAKNEANLNVPDDGGDHTRRQLYRDRRGAAAVPPAPNLHIYWDAAAVIVQCTRPATQMPSGNSPGCSPLILGRMGDLGPPESWAAHWSARRRRSPGRRTTVDDPQQHEAAVSGDDGRLHVGDHARRSVSGLGETARPHPDRHGRLPPRGAAGGILPNRTSVVATLRRPHRREELSHLGLELVALARQRLRRGEHLASRRSRSRRRRD